MWHINRRSCSLAAAVGIFCAFIPVPFQMVIAAFAAILLRINILVTVPLVWISNPVTMPPMFYFCYRLGAKMLDQKPGRFHFELSFEWLTSGLLAIWQPFLLGCFTVGLVSAGVSYFLVRVLWRLHIISHIRERAQRLHNRRRQARESR